jgi:hypothetical protein
MLGYVIASVLVLLASLVLSSTPALGETPDSAVLSWTIIDTPGSIANSNDIRPTCEVNAIALASDGKTIYTIDIPNATPPPVANPGIWKSSDGGITWSPKPMQHLVRAAPAPTLPVMDIAVSPDDPDLIAAVCLNGAGTLRHEVYLSDDGGTNWVYTGAIPWVYGGGEQISDIAISPGYDLNGELTHDIIVGSRHPNDGNGEGEAYILNHPGLSGWRAQGFTSGDIIAIRPSPKYTDDFSLVVMAANTQRTYICLGYRDIAANTSAWNRDYGWPVEMCEASQGGGNTSGEDRIITGDIALPSNFLSTSENKRIIFATYDSNGTALGASQVLDDVYRLNNSRVTRLKVPGAGSSARISTIAYTGDDKAGKLLTGDVDADLIQASAMVWTCYDPLAPCATWKPSLKPPTGGGKDGYANAQLAPGHLTARLPSAPQAQETETRQQNGQTQPAQPGTAKLSTNQQSP